MEKKEKPFTVIINNIVSLFHSVGFCCEFGKASSLSWKEVCEKTFSTTVIYIVTLATFSSLSYSLEIMGFWSWKLVLLSILAIHMPYKVRKISTWVFSSHYWRCTIIYVHHTKCFISSDWQSIDSGRRGNLSGERTNLLSLKGTLNIFLSVC